MANMVNGRHSLNGRLLLLRPESVAWNVKLNWGCCEALQTGGRENLSFGEMSAWALQVSYYLIREFIHSMQFLEGKNIALCWSGIAAFMSEIC